MEENKKYYSKSVLRDIINKIEAYRNNYALSKDFFKGIKALFFINKLKGPSESYATKELGKFISKVLIPIFLFVFAYLLNELFISKGYITGVNNFVITLFCAYAFFTIVSSYNKRGDEILENAQLIARDQSFQIS